MPDDATAVNRANWDARAAVHGQDPIYDSEGLVAGRVGLGEDERAALDLAVGDVSGLSVCHLQCHIGFDSISLARLGARVTGIDFSPASLAKAADLARRCGVAVDFVEADACAPPAALHGRFDLVYATIGVLNWIGDVDAWMGAVADLLRPGGQLVLVEMHPLAVMLDAVDPLSADFPYNHDGPRHFDQDGDYTDLDVHLEATATTEYAHGLGEVVTAAVDAGLEVRHLGEQLSWPVPYRPGLGGPEPDGRFRVRLGSEALPLLYTLIARRR